MIKDGEAGRRGALSHKVTFTLDLFHFKGGALKYLFTIINKVLLIFQLIKNLFSDSHPRLSRFSRDRNGAMKSLSVIPRSNRCHTS